MEEKSRALQLDVASNLTYLSESISTIKKAIKKWDFGYPVEFFLKLLYYCILSRI